MDQGLQGMEKEEMSTQLEFRAGVEACYRRGSGLEAITMLLPNLIEIERCNGVRVNYENS
tara:strand:+ start:753 stop:932 length:180 start_codon:yes stop_codon:yes gene_type:complete